MWCRYRGRTCIMVLEKSSGRVRFIRRRRWFDMTSGELEAYIW